MKMDKKGQIEAITLVGGVIAFIVILVGAGIGHYQITSEQRFIGDSSTKLYYDLAKCDLDKLEKEDTISFKNIKEVEENGYKPAECSLQ